MTLKGRFLEKKRALVNKLAKEDKSINFDIKQNNFKFFVIISILDKIEKLAKNLLLSLSYSYLGRQCTNVPY
jgi:hypothetical protein